MVTGGSIAVKKPDVFSSWIEKFGSERIILGADVKGEKIVVSGWVETTDADLMPFVGKFKVLGVDKVICTDISKDGMLQGPSIELYKKILSEFPDLYLIASGGVSSMADIEALQEAGVPAVITGKAIYEGRIKMEDLTKFILN